MNVSLRGRIILGTSLVVSAQAAAYLWAAEALEGRYWQLLIWALAVIANVVLIVLAFRAIRKTLATLESGISCFRDNDFSLMIKKQRNDELGAIVDAYNAVADTLRKERLSLHQRELMLDNIIQSSQMAVVLTTEQGLIVYHNLAAQQLFGHNRTLNDKPLREVIGGLPEEMLQATLAREKGLVSVSGDGQQTNFFFNCMSFYLNDRKHDLYLYKNLSAEISHRELAVWKNAIRLISHELNNSLAPISSLSLSARQVLSKPEKMEVLPEILSGISERVTHLHEFIDQYAQFAKLPRPNKRPVDLRGMIENLRHICEFESVGGVPDQDVFCDPSQIEQVLINLLKNAAESGSDKEQITLEIRVQEERAVFQVRDRGTGLSETQLKQAMLPFFSSKPKGTGLGLSVCREIVAAHGGSLRLVNRDDGGLCASFDIPDQAEH